MADIDSHLTQLLTYLPTPEGEFDPAFEKLIESAERGDRRVLLGFAPKTGGTFLRTALGSLLGRDYEAQFRRGSYANGTQPRDLYYPMLLADLVRPPSSRRRAMFMHLHLLANNPNRRLIELFRITTFLMARDLLDTLVSYHDELQKRCGDWLPDHALYIDRRYVDASLEDKKQYLIRIALPWYLQYYCSWFDYERDCRERGIAGPEWLTFRELREAPLDLLRRMVERCDLAEKIEDERIEAVHREVWGKREAVRFNQGIDGRGREFFTAAERDQIRDCVRLYADESYERLGILS